MSDAALDHALALLDRVPLIDGHNDLPYVIRHDEAARGDVRAYGLDKPHPRTDTDIPRLREGRVGAQVMAAFVPNSTRHPARETLEQIDVILQIEAAHPDVFLAARRSGDIAAAKAAGKIACIVAIENGIGLENSVDLLRVWYAAGVRLLTLCHGGSLDWVDSATDAPRVGGLNAFGRAVVAEMNRLGMIVDVAHVNHDGIRQAIAASRAPIVVSHGNAFGLCDHPRNVTDDILGHLKATGGMAMACFVPAFVSQRQRDWLRPIHDRWGKAPIDDTTAKAITARERASGPSPRADLPQVCDHIEYMTHIAGVDHVGIGSDFYGGPTPAGLEDVSRFPHLVAELVRRGWSDDALEKLVGANFVRVFAAVEATAASLAGTPPIVGRLEDFVPAPAPLVVA